VSVATILALIAAVIAFSLCASSAYVINDLLDREHDRKHPNKKNRPFARGSLTTQTGCVLALSLLLGAVLVSLVLPREFLVVLVGYFALTLSYSLYIKRLLMLDVVVLVCLYGLRVVAGGVVASVPLSEWLIGFCAFLFLGLALVKRTAELKMLAEKPGMQLAGRGYRAEDLHALQALAGAAGFGSVLVLALYLNSEAVKLLYRHPMVLWSVVPILVFWIGRIVIIAGRGEIHEDPMVFAVTDEASVAAGLLLVLVLVLATG
jgi:4-hydroxybenzoate polyprenyltransferase